MFKWRCKSNGFSSMLASLNLLCHCGCLCDKILLPTEPVNRYIFQQQNNTGSGYSSVNTSSKVSITLQFFSAQFAYTKATFGFTGSDFKLVINFLQEWVNCFKCLNRYQTIVNVNDDTQVFSDVQTLIMNWPLLAIYNKKMSKIISSFWFSHSWSYGFKRDSRSEKFTIVNVFFLRLSFDNLLSFVRHCYQDQTFYETLICNEWDVCCTHKHQAVQVLFAVNEIIFSCIVCLQRAASVDWISFLMTRLKES